MSAKQRAMHVAKICRRYKDKTYVSYLLRRSVREGPQVRHQTLANLSHLPESLILLVQRALQGETFSPPRTPCAPRTRAPTATSTRSWGPCASSGSTP